MSSGKSKSSIWDCFTEIRECNKVMGKCNYCGAIYVTHADRMKKHILKKCTKIPQAVRQKYVSITSYNLTTSEKLKFLQFHVQAFTAILVYQVYLRFVVENLIIFK